MRKIVSNIIAILGVALLPFAAFINVWNLYYEYLSEDGPKYKLFDAFHEDLNNLYKIFDAEFNPFFAKVVMVIAVIAFVAGLAYIVFTLLEAFKVKMGKVKSDKIKRVMAIVLLISSVLIFLFGFVFCKTNSPSIEILGSTIQIVFMVGYGFWALIVGSLVGGLFGLIATMKTKKKRKK